MQILRFDWLRYGMLMNNFSRDVTAAMLASLNKGMAAMFVSPTNSLGIELYSYANVSFVLVEKHAH